MLKDVEGKLLMLNGMEWCIEWSACFRSVEEAGSRDAAARDMVRYVN